MFAIFKIGVVAISGGRLGEIVGMTEGSESRRKWGESMRALLSNTTARRLRLIEALARLNTWVSIEQLVQLLNCTDKTLMKDVEIINEEWGTYLKLDFSKRRGLAIRAGQTNKIKNVYQQVLQESSEFQFLERIFFEPDKDAEYWINELFVSETSFYRMVRQISKELKNYGLTLERKPFCVTAPDERWVRLFYQSYFEEAYGGRPWPFKINQKEMFCYIMRSSSDFGVMLDDRELILDAFLLMITIIRANQGFLLNETIYQQPEDIIDQVILQSRNDMVKLLATSEYILVDKWYREVSHGVFYEFYNWDNPQQEVRIQKAVDHFLDKLVKAADFSLTAEDREKISQRMMLWYLSYTIYPYDRTILLNPSESSARNIRRLYPVFSKLVEVNLKEIEKECNFPWAKVKEEEILCLILKDWAHLPRHLDSLRPPVSLLVVSDRGLKHSKMLRDIIKGQVKDKVKIDLFIHSTLFISPAELEYFHEYDIVVANNPVPEYHDDNLLMVDNFMSEADWDRLYHRILRIQKRNWDHYLQELDVNLFKMGGEVYPHRRKKPTIATFVMEEEGTDSLVE